MSDSMTNSPYLERDIPEWDVPEEVLAILLKDRSAGCNFIWATDDYTALACNVAGVVGVVDVLS